MMPIQSTWLFKECYKFFVHTLKVIWCWSYKCSFVCLIKRENKARKAYCTWLRSFLYHLLKTNFILHSQLECTITICDKCNWFMMLECIALQLWQIICLRRNSIKVGYNSILIAFELQWDFVRLWFSNKSY